MTYNTSTIRELRIGLRLSQKELARKLGMPTNQLSRLERGFDPLSEDTKFKIADVLEIAPSRLRSIDAPLCGEGYVTSQPKEFQIIERSRKLKPTKLAVIDLFCGVGGFSAGFDTHSEFQVSLGIDLLGDRLKTFSTNHPSAAALGSDIRTVTADQIFDNSPPPFVVVGGPPCQGFSSLRPFRNVEWADPRNNLGEEFIRIVSVLKPSWVVFENVVGLVTYNKGETLRAIQIALADLGYRIDTFILNAANFGLPQARERLFVVGNSHGKKFQRPIPTHFFEGRSMAGKSDLLIVADSGLFGDDLRPAVTFDDATSDLPELQAGQAASSYRQDSNVTDYQGKLRSKSGVLTLHEATNHSADMLEIIRHSGKNIHALPAGMVTSGFSSCYSRLDGDKPSTTITVNFVHPASNRCIHPTQNRALTPREGARLQSFHDDFVFAGSRSQIVKQIGNAVPPLLGGIIAHQILRSE